MYLLLSDGESSILQHIVLTDSQFFPTNTDVPRRDFLEKSKNQLRSCLASGHIVLLMIKLLPHRQLCALTSCFVKMMLFCIEFSIIFYKSNRNKQNELFSGLPAYIRGNQEVFRVLIN